MPPHPSTPAERVWWVGLLLAHAGEYGVVTALSRRVGVSRQTLYAWRARGRAAVEQAFARPARRPAPALVRCILTLLVEGHASDRGIQACLRELLGWEVGLGTIAGVVRAAGARAEIALAELAPPQPRPLALDELFGGSPHAGYLSAVDAHSGAVWGVAGPITPAAAVWEEVLGGLRARGLQWPVAVHDGGKAAAGGSAAVTPDGALQRDVWHPLHRCAQVQARVDRLVAAAEAAWERAERYEAAAATGRRPRQRPPARSAVACAAAVDSLAGHAAGLAYLTGEIRRLLGVVVVERGRLLDLAARRAELVAALALLADLATAVPPAVQPELTRLHRHLAEALEGLLVFATTLEPVQQELDAVLGAEAVGLLAWAWERRAILGAAPEDLVAQVPAAWRPAAWVLLAAWAGAVRASSAVEGWHSLLRPHLAVHRTLPPHLLALLAIWHNHRCFARGTHAGQSPLQRSGLLDAPTDWLTALGYPPTPASRPPALTPPEEVRLAA